MPGAKLRSPYAGLFSDSWGIEPETVCVSLNRLCVCADLAQHLRLVANEAQHVVGDLDLDSFVMRVVSACTTLKASRLLATSSRTLAELRLRIDETRDRIRPYALRFAATNSAAAASAPSAPCV
jgi:hypothetical protein